MSLRIVFMGTPDFAVPALEILADHGYDIAAVVTATDKWGGRGGKQLLQSAVKQAALARHIPVLQPEKLRDETFVDQLRQLQADLQVVVAFRMLPEVVWAMPRLGTFNLHASLLPRYRGAAPINWAVINGETETGATTFFIQHAIDTGDLLFQTHTPIGENETAGEVHDRLMYLGAQLVLQTVQAIESNQYTPQPQDESLACPAPKIYVETCRINFDQPLRHLHNFVRGLSPHPGAWTTLQGQTLKIFRTLAWPEPHSHPHGLVQVTDKQLRVAVPGGWLQLLEVQLEGKRRMSAADFLNGWRLPEDSPLILGE